jgi:hypothetical protein
MAIRIPILTSFDPKGLRQANAQFAKLQTSVGSLGRNFAAAGVAIAAAGAIIAKNAQSLARIERINAQTAQTIKSMGNASNISATEVEALAGSLENLTATEAETIQEGANLLLTFKNISNQAGAGNDIFTQTTAVMVDLARAMGTSASGEAIRLGKALNDPVKGIAALTRVGVSFTEGQKEQIKALAQSGDLLGAQKIILAELQTQFGGSGAAFAKTFTGQLELMGHELGTIGEEATMSVMPALQGMVEELRELIPVIGPQLKAAIESVDFKALATSVIDLTTFLINNAEVIGKSIAALFILSTAYKTMAVVVGIAKTATALYTWSVAQATAGTALATTATTIFSTALRLIPIVAIISGLALLVAAFTNTTEWAGKSASGVATFAGKLEVAGGKAGVLVSQLNKIPKQITTTYTLIRQTAGEVASSFGGSAFDSKQAEFEASQITKDSNGKAGAGGAKSKPKTFSEVLKREKTLATREAKLLKAGVSQGLADLVVSTATTKKSFQKELKKISKSPDALTKVQEEFNKTAAGRAEVSNKAAQAASAAAESAAESAATMREAQQEANEALAEAARSDAEALAERERVYNSFLDSVKSTFGNIKNAILGAFDLTQLGGSTNSITRNMDKLLVKLRSFSTNVAKLSGMGLNSALLQQVISAGPLAGAKLAESLVMGGAGGLAAINAGYSEFGNLAGQIATTGTKAMFGSQAQQSVYNIEVNGGVGSGATIGKAIVDAIKAYERTSGAVWQGA